MEASAIRAALGEENIDCSAAVGIFRAITSLVNSHSTHDLGREMVVRALAVKNRLPDQFIPLLNSLVQTVGLLPYLDIDSRETLEDFALYEAHKVPETHDGAVFHTLQLQIYRLLISGTNVVLSATTSVGKSLIVDAVIASRRYRTIVVVVPTIALIDETRRRLVKKFGDTHSIITHQSQERVQGKPTLFILTQERVLARKDLRDVDFFVIDEFYKLDMLNSNDERAVDLNLCFHRLASQGAKFYLIGPHVQEVRGLAERYNHFFIPSQYSTVAVDVVQFNLPKSGDSRLKEAVRLCVKLTEATIVYCQSPGKCSEVAEALIESGHFPKIDATADAVSWLRNHFPNEWTVIRALEHGIAIHHANVPRAIQQYAVRAFEEAHVSIMICTSTIIEGVNTAAKNVIIYDRRIKNSTINYFTYKNIAGRAGRMGWHYIGKVFVLEEPPEEDVYAVHLPIETQTEHTPVSLLLDLPEGDLAPISRKRLEEISGSSLLSFETIKDNRHVPIEVQNKIAEILLNNPVLRRALSWRGSPDGPQLQAACNVRFDHFEIKATLKGHQIHSGEQLAACLTNLRNTKSLREFIDSRLPFKRPNESVSESVENTLRLLRKYIGYRLPKQLIALENIHRDISRRIGERVQANYELYAVQVESLFIDSGLFALDEYGLPPEMTRKLMRNDLRLQKLDEAIRYALSIDVNEFALDPFEKQLIENFRASVKIPAK
ncbi:DEAD/DEAH box helicase [Methylorubrum extorquens]|uniref:DEAD/DEAH box helicase n=1 Tax=Methylorubrum extorquens TaxID=408 RepID=UPI002238D78F|nr:DEAD/DEAH box helicase [Methylorubrum extorquens]UYW31250.1 DEAD/DEAH box helicase [Methylorubrum extorquens]